MASSMDYSVCDSIGYSVGKQGTSLYGAAVLNLLVISSAFPSVNQSRHHTKLTF
jgi:hypothetical protein